MAISVVIMQFYNLASIYVLTLFTNFVAKYISIKEQWPLKDGFVTNSYYVHIYKCVCVCCVSFYTCVFAFTSMCCILYMSVAFYTCGSMSHIFLHLLYMHATFKFWEICTISN